MRTLKIKRHYYNGVVHSFSTISDSIKYEIKENSITATIEREHYGDESENYKHYTIKVRALLI